MNTAEFNVATNTVFLPDTNLPQMSPVKFDSDGYLPVPLVADMTYFAFRVKDSEGRVNPEPYYHLTTQAGRLTPLDLTTTGSGQARVSA